VARYQCEGQTMRDEVPWKMTCQISVKSHGYPLAIKHCNGIFPIEMWFLMGKPSIKGGIRHENSVKHHL